MKSGVYGGGKPGAGRDDGAAAERKAAADDGAGGTVGHCQGQQRYPGCHPAGQRPGRGACSQSNSSDSHCLNICPAGFSPAGLRLSKNPFGAFRQVYAVCHAHNLSPDGRQIPHLQPVKYVPPGTCPGGTLFLNYFTPNTGKETALFDTPSPAGFSQVVLGLRKSFRSAVVRVDSGCYNKG